jgi:hypothetical protein
MRFPVLLSDGAYACKATERPSSELLMVRMSTKNTRLYLNLHLHIGQDSPYVVSPRAAANSEETRREKTRLATRRRPYTMYVRPRHHHHQYARKVVTQPSNTSQQKQHRDHLQKMARMGSPSRLQSQPSLWPAIFSIIVGPINCGRRRHCRTHFARRAQCNIMAFSCCRL